jgi:hypothetical protein
MKTNGTNGHSKTPLHIPVRRPRRPDKYKKHPVDVQEALKGRKKGYRCPHCSRQINMGTRTIHGEPALFLRMLVKLYLKEPRWYRTNEVLKALGMRTRKNSTDASYLKHWGIVEQGPEKGLYRPTKKGINFALGKIRVSKAALVYNNECYGFVEEMTDIRSALAEKFDLSKVFVD